MLKIHFCFKIIDIGPDLLEMFRNVTGAGFSDAVA